ncbi:DNA ligase 1 isoform X4 [Apis cerana]|uniref:DNA ligase 1 isoform X4 n=1 Tax=Apis cerana TaxID=7461 RepID=UPI002B22E932|nr:DNA ligase 1 isoform X4 [Apis cerana]
MTGSRLRRPAYFVGLFLALLVAALQGVQSEEELEVPPEDLCRPYIEKALKDLGSLEQTSAEVGTDVDKESQEEEGKPASKEELETEASKEDAEESVDARAAESVEQAEEEAEKASAEAEQSTEVGKEQSAEADETKGEEEEKSGEVDKGGEEEKKESAEQAKEHDADSGQEETEETKEEKSGEEAQADEGKSEEETQGNSEKSKEEDADKSDIEIGEDEGKSDEKSQVDDGKSDEARAEGESAEEPKIDEEKSDEEAKTEEIKSDEEKEKIEDEATDSKAEEETEKVTSKEEGDRSTAEEEGQSAEQQASEDETKEENKEGESVEDQIEGTKESEEAKSAEETGKSTEQQEAEEGTEEEKEGDEGDKSADVEEKSVEEAESKKEEAEKSKSRARREVGEEEEGGGGEEDAEGSKETEEQNEEEEPTPEEDLIREIVIPENLRPRDHINQLLKLDEENEEKERAIQKIADIVLKELKRVYDNAIQPLESLYKYRDLSNRHFGDPEIFSKPLVLFMGPWSGGKSSIINYLLDIEYKQTSLRTGAEPSPAYFNIIMHGEEEEILDGTQLAADWTFSGLQKFGQGLLDRLKGLRLDNKLLEKVNIVEIPGILEIRKQVQRLFPFNDACQWFIDRADIIFLVYDPSKLDVGPETEAILDQLKGREHQTRIILNKADQVKPEELMRVQGALIWNISPLMSSAEPPIMYSTSLWSIPYEAGAPTRLLYAQERAFLRDLRTAIDKQVEHKIASARRFAVRVRNHAKMVDCYLTTYYNHKTFFGNKKEISDKIIENPQDYHIYEGLSTLKNISRYDLPDPDVYRDFFRLNPLYDFPLLSSTCTYFRGCPINRLDVAIAYDLPELVGKYKKSVEQVIHEYETSPPS